MIISDRYLDPGRFSEEYRLNDPFPHIVFDDFISSELANSVLDEFPDLSALHSKVEFSNQKEIKFATTGSADLSPAARTLINHLNSDLFLEYLQRLTGIEETLISDPYLSGGGYHQIKSGGFLKVHADFNKHPKLNLDRRLNLLLYFNKDWDTSWGGCLELFDDRNLSTPAVSIEPLFNRCVIFSTTSFTYHGHPAELACPPDRSRKSIALYYFSTGRPQNEVSKETHGTLFVGPKGEKLLPDMWSLVLDWTPPILVRGLKRIGRSLASMIDSSRR